VLVRVAALDEVRRKGRSFRKQTERGTHLSIPSLYAKIVFTVSL
jgi:hypothetical protein